MPRQPSSPPISLLLAGVGLLVPIAGAAAQEDRLFLPHDLELEQGFDRAERLAEHGQWDRVVAQLDELLARGGGVLLETDEGYRTVRAEARRRLLALEGPGRAAYALVHEDAARRLLDAGVRTAAVEPLETLLAEHPASPLAPRARRLLVSRYAERGEPGPALVHTEQLLGAPPDRPGLDAEERRRLERARVLCLARVGRTGEALQAIEVRVEDPAAAERLRGLVESVRPADPAPPPDDPARLAWSREVFGYYETTSGSSLPWTLPRADASLAYAHDGSHALALDLRSGRLAWRTALRPEDAFVRPAGLCRVAVARGAVVCVLPGGRGLVGLDRREGSVLWRRPLDALKEAAGIDFPAHLAGRPRVLGDDVVVGLVTEHDDREVHVLAVDLRGGDLAWSVFVASQTGGASPHPQLACGLGRVAVVTGLGATAALDGEGEIVWLRRYESRRDGQRAQDSRGRGFPFGGRGRRQVPQRDPTAVVARGTLWASPSDGTGFHAWDLRTGEPRAHVERPGKGRILGGEGKGVLVLSAGGDVYRVTRAGGELVEQLGGTLAARPCVAAGTVWIPRSDGLVEVDLAGGEARRHATWETTGGPGSVVVSGGRLLVGAPRGLYAFGGPSADAEPLAPDASDGALVAALGDPAFARREEASRRLLERGEEAREALAAAARSSDPEVRRRAEVVLGELARRRRLADWRPLVKEAWEEEVTDLLDRLTHPNPRVRLKALHAMGGIEDEDALVLLRDLLEDEDLRVAATAAASLLGRGDRSGVDVLGRAVRKAGLSGRLAAVEALAASGEADDSDLVRPGLADEAAELRAAAVRGVFALGGEDEAGEILPLVDDEADAVRAAVVEVLKGIPGWRSVEALVKAAGDENDMIRAGAVEELARRKLEDPKVLRALGLVLGDPVREIARTAARRLLNVADDEDARLIPAEGIARGAELEDDTYRYWVAQIAIFYADAGGVLPAGTLARFLGDPVDEIRTLRVAGGTGWGGYLVARAKAAPLTEDEVEAIAELTLDDRVYVRHNAFLALARAVQAPGRRVLLARALRDEDARVRGDAVEWLTSDPEEGADLLDAEAIEAVLALAADDDAQGSGAAGDVLAGLAPARLYPLLLPAVEAEDPAVRAEAGRRLQALTEGEVAWDPDADPTRLRRAFTVWRWRRDHPELTPEDLVARLSSDNPSRRWQAAQAAAELPLPSVRNGVIGSLGGEELGWVLKEKLKAAVALTGERLGFREDMSGEELRRCAGRFEAWLSERLHDEIRGGPR